MTPVVDFSLDSAGSSFLDLDPVASATLASRASEAIAAVLPPAPTPAILSGPSRTVGGCSPASPCSVWVFGDSNTGGMANIMGPMDDRHPEFDIRAFPHGPAYPAPEFASDGATVAEAQLTLKPAPAVAIVILGTADIIQLTVDPGFSLTERPTTDQIDAIYQNLANTCDVFTAHGVTCVMATSPGAYYTLQAVDAEHPEDFYGPGQTSPLLEYLDNGVSDLNATIRAQYRGTVADFHTPQDPQLWGTGNLGYFHLSSIGYYRMVSHLEEALRYIIAP